jgi:hypothetical protein
MRLRQAGAAAGAARRRALLLALAQLASLVAAQQGSDNDDGAARPRAVISVFVGMVILACCFVWPCLFACSLCSRPAQCFQGSLRKCLFMDSGEPREHVRPRSAARLFAPLDPRRRPRRRLKSLARAEAELYHHVRGAPSGDRGLDAGVGLFRVLLAVGPGCVRLGRAALHVVHVLAHLHPLGVRDRGKLAVQRQSLLFWRETPHLRVRVARGVSRLTLRPAQYLERGIPGVSEAEWAQVLSSATERKIRRGADCGWRLRSRGRLLPRGGLALPFLALSNALSSPCLSPSLAPAELRKSGLPDVPPRYEDSAKDVVMDPAPLEPPPPYQQRV